MEKWEGGVESHVLYARVKLTPLFARLRSTGVRLRLRRSSCVASERTVSMTTMRMFGRFTQGWAVGRAGAAGGGTGRATGTAADASTARRRAGLVSAAERGAAGSFEHEARRRTARSGPVLRKTDNRFAPWLPRRNRNVFVY